MTEEAVIGGAKPKNAQERMEHELVDRVQAKTALTWMQVLNAAARPFMTFMFAVTFSIVCFWAWHRGDITAQDYMREVGPIVATLVGFWFGERAAANRRESNQEGEA